LPLSGDHGISPLWKPDPEDIKRYVGVAAEILKLVAIKKIGKQSPELPQL